MLVESGNIKNTVNLDKILARTERQKLDINYKYEPHEIAIEIEKVIEDLFDYSPKTLPVYTIHDCFATSANKMTLLEKMIKKCLINIYFKDQSYLTKMHNHLIAQIKSYVDVITEDGIEKVIIDNVKIELPSIPEEFVSNKHKNAFFNGILNSRYFLK